MDDFKLIYDKIETEKEYNVHKECIDEIVNALENNQGYFNSVEMLGIPSEKNGKTVLLQTNVKAKGNWADIELIINEDIFKGKTLKEINDIILNSYNANNSVIRNLK